MKLTRLLIIGFFGLLTVLLLIRLSEIDISWQTLQQINIVYLGIAIVFHYSGFIIRGIRWQKILQGLGYKLNYSYTTALLMTGWFVSALVPARMGDIVRAYMLKRDHKISLAYSLGSIATERALDISAILLLAMYSAMWALANQTPAWVWQSIVAGVIFIIIAIIFILTTPKIEQKLRLLTTWLLYQKMLTFFFELLASIRQLGQNPILLTYLFLQSIYIWLCDVALMYFGAVGQFEATALGIFALFQVNHQQSSLVILLNRFISFWSFIIVSGFIAYWFGFSQVLKSNKTMSGTET
ncbi:MAG: hypothetical protein B6242_06305 [Anaerolineaceae bacterium 4572_78]|nr:MAG: hypothetical protein B6242_06305 [Anaerolineaceae bacterium 4572_78]